MGEHDDGVEPDGSAEGSRDRLEQRQIREVEPRGLIHAVEVQHDIGLVLAGETFGVRHDLGVVLDVRAGRLETRGVDETQRHAVHLVLDDAHRLRLAIERVRRGGALAEQRVDRGRFPHAGLAEKEDGAGEVEVGVGALTRLRRLRQRDGAIKGRRLSATTRRLLPALQLFGELEAIDHLRHDGVARGLTETRRDAKELAAEVLKLPSRRRLLIRRGRLGLGLNRADAARRGGNHLRDGRAGSFLRRNLGVGGCGDGGGGGNVSRTTGIRVAAETIDPRREGRKVRDEPLRRLRARSNRGRLGGRHGSDARGECLGGIETLEEGGGLAYDSGGHAVERRERAGRISHLTRRRPGRARGSRRWRWRRRRRRQPGSARGGGGGGGGRGGHVGRGRHGGRRGGGRGGGVSRGGENLVIHVLLLLLVRLVAEVVAVVVRVLRGLVVVVRL